MADEEDLEAWDWEGDANVNRVDPDDYTVLLPLDIHPRAYSKYPLQRLVQAAYDGDLELLEKMLDREDPISGYHHDINEHLEDINALHAAALNGQLEAVQLLLDAGADPHVRQSMPPGQNPQDGETAREMADQFGWDDVATLLQQAEERVPKGRYLRYGPGNNAKLWPIDRPEGLDPAQERRAKRKHRGLLRPLPAKEERKFYGDLVFGVTHGWDESGEVIREPRPFAQGSASAPSGGAGAGGSARPAARSPVGLLFPDQAALQGCVVSPDMRKNRRVQELLATAKRVLGFDVTEARAESAEVAQLARYVACTVALERLREQRPEAAERPGAVAGLGLGEFAALTAAGVVDFELGLRLVQARAAAIARQAAETPQGVLSVAGLDAAQLERLCEDAGRRTGGLCRLSAELFPQGCVCAGTLAALGELKRLVDQAGAIQTKLVEAFGAVHTPLMDGARDALRATLDEASSQLRPPLCDVYMNATGKVIHAGTPARQLVPALCDQLSSRVLWEACLRVMLAAGATELYEVGPQKQLKGMMKRIDAEAWSRMETIEP